MVQKPPRSSITPGRAVFMPNIPAIRVRGNIMAPMMVRVVITSVSRALDLASESETCER